MRGIAALAFCRRHCELGCGDPVRSDLLEKKEAVLKIPNPTGETWADPEVWDEVDAKISSICEATLLDETSDSLVDIFTPHDVVAAGQERVQYLTAHFEPRVYRVWAVATTEK